VKLNKEALDEEFQCGISALEDCVRDKADDLAIPREEVSLYLAQNLVDAAVKIVGKGHRGFDYVSIMLKDLKKQVAGEN
jgi:hypothetical protein